MMNRRELMQWSAAAATLGLPSLGAFAQTSLLKPGKPYAGQTVNVLTVVAPGMVYTILNVWLIPGQPVWLIALNLTLFLPFSLGISWCVLRVKNFLA